ncbi:hypothetical protein [Candidatus Palauibacter sp.]|uniref:hypothetical protein n=1 Tax=Candidatus Palauibacter sp. TaxID=3101350 RepID=UPI003B523451
MNDLARAVEMFVSINLIALGASFLLRPGDWKALLTHLQSKGTAGSLPLALIGLGVGSFVVAFHNIWDGVPMIVTIYGWAALLKGTFQVLYPGIALKRIDTALRMGAGLWRTAGTLALVFGVLVLRYALQG